jgi:molecular chaperone HscB
VNPLPSERTEDFFELLGLPRRFEIDRDVLEDAYLAIASAVHPDRFATADLGQRRWAMERSARVNEAYRTLRDPAQRAEYLLQLAGIDLDSSDSRSGATAMDHGFLVEMLERREQLEAAAADGPRALMRLRSRVEDETERALSDGVASLAAGDVQAAARALTVRRYLQRLVEEIAAACG